LRSINEAIYELESGLRVDKPESLSFYLSSRLPVQVDINWTFTKKTERLIVETDEQIGFLLERVAKYNSLKKLTSPTLKVDKEIDFIQERFLEEDDSNGDNINTKLEEFHEEKTKRIEEMKTLAARYGLSVEDNLYGLVNNPNYLRDLSAQLVDIKLSTVKVNKLIEKLQLEIDYLDSRF